MAKILVADDHQLIVDDIIDELHDIVPEAECIGTNDAGAILGLVDSNRFDVIFMDIDIPGIRGDDAARIFRSIRPEQEIVFVSSHDEYAYDVFDIKPIAFVRKNRIDEDFPRAMDNLLKEIRRKKMNITFSRTYLS